MIVATSIADDLRALADRIDAGDVVVADLRRLEALLDTSVGADAQPGRREALLDSARGLGLIQNLAALAAAGTLAITSGNIFYSRDGLLMHKRGPLVATDADPTHYKLVLYLEPTPELKAELTEVADDR